LKFSEFERSWSGCAEQCLEEGARHSPPQCELPVSALEESVRIIFPALLPRGRVRLIYFLQRVLAAFLAISDRFLAGIPAARAWP
jgi:hypothetical protein